MKTKEFIQKLEALVDENDELDTDLCEWALDRYWFAFIAEVQLSRNILKDIRRKK